MKRPCLGFVSSPQPGSFKKLLRLAIPLLALAGALLLVGPQPSSAHNDRYDQLLPRHTSGMCIDVNGAYTSNGALIIQWPCHGGANQDLTITDMGSGYHEIRFRHSGKCLDVPGWSTSWGTQLQQWTCNGTTAQRFTVACTGCAGEIRNQNSGLCLDVDGAFTWAGAKIIQWGCHSGANQQFLVRDTYAVGLAPATGNWAQNIPSCPTNPEPSCHHVTSCEPTASGDYYYFVSSGNCNGGLYPDMGGDWATDYYAPSGSLIKFQALGVGTAGANVTARVWAITQTCSQVSRANGGATVFVDVFTNGFWEGWYAYGHLDNVVVQPGQLISSGTALGKTEWWTNAGGCYQVSSEAGVHAHIEMYNRDDPNYSGDGYACYIRYNYYQGLSSVFPLGHIGRTIYDALRPEC